jgi:hypothetical protein
LETAIEKAALAIDQAGKRSSHHRRRTRNQLCLGKSALVAVLPKLRKCSDFHQLHDLVRSATKPIKGLGSLYAYDISYLIGARLGLSPKKVFLHAGTRKGARALGFSGGLLHLLPSQLPRQLQVLKAYEMEDFLCIYAPYLRKFRGKKQD